MARTFELVFTRLPVGSAAQMRAASVDHKESVRSLSYPNAILLLPLCIDAEGVISWRADAKDAGRFKNRAR